MVKVGIVGLGYTMGIAQLHIQAYKRLSNVQVSALYDIIPGRAEDYARRLGLVDAKICTSYEELLSKVDAVSICTPNATHVELSVLALKAGKHVLCEKPFTDDVHRCDEALKYAELSQRVCMIGLCYRGIPAYMYMKQLISEGKLGDIFYLKAALGGNRIANPDVKLEWRMQKALSGTGAMGDFGSHMLDITDYLLADCCGTIKQVNCMSNTFVGQRKAIGSDKLTNVTNDDVAFFTAKLANGTLASFAASRLGSDDFTEVYGSGGYVRYNGRNPFEVTVNLKEHNGGYTKEAQVIKVPEEVYMVDTNVPKVSFEINFYLQAKAFINAIETGATVDTDFVRGQYIQSLLKAVELAAATGTTVEVD